MIGSFTVVLTDIRAVLAIVGITNEVGIEMVKNIKFYNNNVDWEYIFSEWTATVLEDNVKIRFKVEHHVIMSFLDKKMLN